MQIKNNKERFVASKYFNEISKSILKIKNSNSQFILYGYGQIGQYINSQFSDKIVLIVDRNYANINKELNIQFVESIESLKNFKNSKIIISVLGRENEISAFLMKTYDIDMDNIISLEVGKEYQSLNHEKIFVNSTYSPWNNDLTFLNIYHVIKNSTLVDKFKCYLLYEQVQQVKKLEEGSFIEIGVWRGGTGALISKTVQDLNIKEKVYLCDTFTGVVKSSKYDTHYKNGEHKDTSIALVEDLLQKLDISNVKILKGIFPDETGESIANKKFRLCHIDVDVYQSAKDIISWIWDKIVIGGIIIFDDYGFPTCDGITKIVNEQKNLKNRIVIHNLNGQAIIIKISAK